MKHFLDIESHDPDWLRHVLAVAEDLRRERREHERNEPLLADRTMAVLFEKPSLRTRVSFEQAANELGGDTIVMQQHEFGLGTRETAGDIGRVLGGMVQAICARVFEHRKLEELAAAAGVPVINALSDASHPCQALADLLTMRDEFGADLTGRKLAFVGDGNNVAVSLARLCAKLGVRFAIASPPDYAIPTETLAQLRRAHPEAELTATDEPARAVADADAVYTDTFVSMGQEREKQNRLETFRGYQVNDELLAHAPGRAIVLHCLPANRGVEITDAVMDGPRSRVFPQAHNRLHAQKGLLAVLLGGI